VDRIKRAASVIREINRNGRGVVSNASLIKSICDHFDKSRLDDLNPSDSQFLYYLANVAGVPHYYDLIQKIGAIKESHEFSLSSMAASIYESSLHTTDEQKLHRYQMEVLEQFSTPQRNRFLLSASTSFGKTHLVFEIIRKMGYNNVLLIFPTIALLSENLEKLVSDPRYKHFNETYSIHTLSDPQNIGDRNIFIFTPERFLSFIDKHHSDVPFDFSFVDEVYKIESDRYLDTEEAKENERDVSYRLAIHYILKRNSDLLFAGPYLEFAKELKTDTSIESSSFGRFLNENEIVFLDYNRIEIVNKTIRLISKKGEFNFDEELTFNFGSIDKTRMLLSIINDIVSKGENVIIYCPQRRQVESYARKIAESESFAQNNKLVIGEFISHMSNKFPSEWSLISALQSGVGMHHGLIPKYIQKEIIRLFNANKIPVLLATTTITEGVNTSAKNVLVLESAKGNKPLKQFDAKNIAGRAGRFNQHFRGRVIVLKNEFLDVLNSEPEELKYKNYDLDAPKSDIDIFYSDDAYLNKEQMDRKNEIIAAQLARGIPDEIMQQFRSIGRMEKIQIYDAIAAMTSEDHLEIRKLINVINSFMSLSFSGFQVILDAIRPIVKNENVLFLIDQKKQKQGEAKPYSVISRLIHAYLKGGFNGSVEYKISNGDKVDAAIRETSKFVYNTLKYQVVKYLGAFNAMYKYYQQTNSERGTKIIGIDLLIMKLEYNAITERGRIASDYGVPYSIIEYYENESRASAIKSSFDAYEDQLFESISNMIEKNMSDDQHS